MAPAGPPAPAATPEPPRRRWWLAWRVAVAAVGVVALSGGATAAIALNEVSRLTEALEQNKPVKLAPNVLAPTRSGAPETLLLVGNDERRRTTTAPVLPHSNEMLLVRVDPSKPTISILSIPRELKVPIHKPDGEVEENRINSAYTYGWENGGGTAGGVKLMLETIKQVLGIAVNHVFVTNFKKFAEAVNDIGCVYMTVDKRYYHSNSEPGAEQYFEINLHPGYQKLCGLEALEFVANRHESTSLIRDARDQRFLLEAKAEYGPSVFENREKYERIFGKYVETHPLRARRNPATALPAGRIRRQAGAPGRLPRQPGTDVRHGHARTDSRSGRLLPQRAGGDPRSARPDAPSRRTSGAQPSPSRLRRPRFRAHADERL